MRLDHVIVAVNDLDAAQARFAAILGRPPALRSEHPRGTANVLFLFPHGPYLELLARRPSAVVGSSALALERRLAQRGEGLHGIAFATDDIDAEVATLRAGGFDITEPVENSGVSVDGFRRAWRATRLPGQDGETAFLIQHLGPDWRTTFQRTPADGRRETAIDSIHHVAFDVPDAGAESQRWEAAYGLRRVRVIDSPRMAARVIVHDAGAATIEFVGATSADGPVAARMARSGFGLSSLAFAVRDIAAATTAVRAAGIELGNPEPGVLPDSRVARIAPASACGVSAQLLQFN